MKKVKLFSFALAALMLGACSSEDDLNTGGQPQWNSQGKGYINLAIQLPTQPSTRAANDQFEDGTPDEYDVKDATLILFVDGVVNSAYDMKLNFSMDGSSDNITTTAKITQEINKVNKVEDSEPSPKIQALVVLNRNNAFTVEGSDLKVKGNSMKGESLESLNQKVSDAIGQTYSWHDNGLLMSNAVMSNVAGGDQEPTNAEVVGPLVTIDGNNIYSTKAEADAKPAATIYVERAEAKVTVKDAVENKTVTNESGFTYTIDGWTLDNTNQTNKLVRDVNGFGTWNNYKATNSSNYRFIGETKIADGLFRVYWGDDYNYSTTGVGGLTTVGGPHATLSAVNPANGEFAAYCFENTTDLTNMLEQNLTRVIVKATFNGGVGFYTVDDNRGKMWTGDYVKKEVAARLLADIDFNKWAYKNVKAGETLSSETDFNVTLSGDEKVAGQCTVTEITLNDVGKGKLKDGAIDTYPADAVDLANKHIVLNYYAGGASYYPVYIKHFGDDLTPWTTGAYDTDANFLGRYGVLRNNWYEINVESIRSLGDPNVTEVTPDPVDEDESYISVNINVLSWAKRTQGVVL